MLQAGIIGALPGMPMAITKTDIITSITTDTIINAAIDTMITGATITGPLWKDMSIMKRDVSITVREHAIMPRHLFTIIMTDMIGIMNGVQSRA